jgi:hypothetical protein
VLSLTHEFVRAYLPAGWRVLVDLKDVPDSYHVLPPEWGVHSGQRPDLGAGVRAHTRAHPARADGPG